VNESTLKTIEALKKNNMKPFYVETKEEIIPLIESLMEKGDKVAFGGSVTLSSIDAVEYMKNGGFSVIDRYEDGISPQERKKRFREAFFADVFLTSSNAITTNGDLVNVDGIGNRVAAMIYGPDSVIVVACENKITDSIEDAFDRIKKIAAPKNCQRLGMETYCFAKGECMGLMEENHSITSGCGSENRICCDYTILSKQRAKDRIKVIICKENLGY